MARTRRTTDRARSIRTVVPATVVGALAATLVAAPADAAEQPRVVDALRSDAQLRMLVQKLAAATAVARTSAAATTHVVRDGDTVWAIASRHGLRVADVIAWNTLPATAVIHPGQTLRLTAPTAAAAPAPAATPTPTPPAASKTHTVRAGDTLSGIATTYGVGLSTLFAANGMGYSTVIFPGQTLAIPSAGAAPAAAPAPQAKPQPKAAPAATGGYTVRSGDTLTAIASAHGLTLSQLFTANGLGYGSIIYPGQTLSVAAPAPVDVNAPHPVSSALTAEQKANAQRIIAIGRELGVSDRGIAIALATAMVESWMRNLDWGDRDSLGLFQQRPSMGWGTEAQVRDVDRAIRVFYGGRHDPNGSASRGLLDIPGWEKLGFGEAAQAVQVSAHPDRYGRWEQVALGWVAALG